MASNPPSRNRRSQSRSGMERLLQDNSIHTIALAHECQGRKLENGLHAPGQKRRGPRGRATKSCTQAPSSEQARFVGVPLLTSFRPFASSSALRRTNLSWLSPFTPILRRGGSDQIAYNCTTKIYGICCSDLMVAL